MRQCKGFVPKPFGVNPLKLISSSFLSLVAPVSDVEVVVIQ